MVWIESHQSLKDHPKTRKLARILETSLPATIGHLQCLWWWSVDYAQDGDLTRHDRLDIAIGGEWDGDPDVFVDALTKAGFIDLDDDGTLWIHDWDDYIGKLLDRRKANAERARSSRERRNSGQRAADDAPETPQRTPDVTPESAQDAEGVRAACAQRAEESAHAAVLPTNQPTNQTKPTVFGTDSGGDDPPGDPPDAPPAPKPRASRQKPAVSFPDDFTVDGAAMDYAVGKGMTEQNARIEFERFHNWALGKGERKQDWLASWRNWVLKDIRDNGTGGTKKPGRKPFFWETL